MIESSQTPTEGLSPYIREAMIDPIRHLTIIDDEYPTIDDFINPEWNSRAEDNQPRIATIRKFRNFCKSQMHTWTFEILNSTPSAAHTSDSHSANYSDLIVLDYHLDKGSPDNNGKSINFIREISQNGRFKLVIIHTGAASAAKGVGFDSGAKDIAAEVALSLMPVAWGVVDALIGSEAYTEALPILEDEFELTTSTFVKSLSAFLMTQMRMMSSIEKCLEVFLGVGEINLGIEQLKAKLINASRTSDDRRVSIKEFPKYVMAAASDKWRKENAAKFQPTSFPALDVIAIGCDQNSNWIQANNTFITVAPKAISPEHLLETLEHALNTWKPLPQRVLLAKLRSEITLEGGQLEKSILLDRQLQAGLLDNFNDSSKTEHSTSVSKSISQTWESLGVSVQNNTKAFASKLSRKADDRFFEGLDWGNEFDPISTPLKLNIQSCCKQIELDHLRIGHILKTANPDEHKYWLCLTPACDLVPGSKKGIEEIDCEDKRPFSAIRLYPHPQTKISSILATATDSNFIFFVDPETGVASAFSHFPPDAEPSSAPKWRRFFANGDGLIKSDQALIADALRTEKKQLSVYRHEFKVIAQLRYENALHLLQKFTGHLSRVGLNFVNHYQHQVPIKKS
jgi:hypothetical protein